jgi:Tfp pilus assembly protein PilN
LIALFVVWRTSALRSEFAQLEREQAEARTSLEDVGKRLLTRSGDPSLRSEIGKLEALVSAPEAALQLLRQDVFGTQQGYSSYLVALARQSVAGVWVTHLHIVGAGRQVELRGRALSPEAVPRYLQRLSNERALRGLEFDQFQLGQPQAPGGEAAADETPALPRAEKGVVEFVLRTQRNVPATAQAGTP